VLVLSASNAIAGDSFDGGYRLRGLKVSSSGGSGVLVSNAWVQMDRMDFGTCVVYQIAAQRGAYVALTGNYSISANAVGHLYADTASVISASGITVTLTGTPAFSTAYAWATMLGCIYLTSVSFVGSATGPRYLVNYNAVIQTGGLTLPGGTAGSAATGGQYA
jgi:hypothetical protein